MYFMYYAYLSKIHFTKHDEETETQNKLYLLVAEEVVSPF